MSFCVMALRKCANLHNIQDVHSSVQQIRIGSGDLAGDPWGRRPVLRHLAPTGDSEHLTTAQ